MRRQSVAGAIVLAAITVGIGLAVPQDGAATGLAGRLGLDRVFSSWWFLAVCALISVQLTGAITRLCTRDLRRIRRDRGPASADPMTVRDASRLAVALKAAGYRRIRRSATTARYVKHVWGYAGPTLLHLGMLAAILGALMNSLTLSSGNLVLLEGATVAQGEPLGSARYGPLADPPVLSQTLRCDGIDITYWPDGEPRRIEGLYSIVRLGGDQSFRVATNAPLVVDGVRFFQDSRVGYAYGVTLMRGETTTKHRLDLPLPESGDSASYIDTLLENGDMLRAKVTHDPSAPMGDPVLTLRLVRGEDIIGEESFSSTGAGVLGDTEVSVDIATRWSMIALERSRGAGMLFAGFFIILLGAALIYAATPREFTLVGQEDGTATADWHAARFAALYAAEERALRAAASGTGVDADD
ncbi:MAG: cytochrome c biogenesis protein ResB [Coriobacteriia bacterium]